VRTIRATDAKQIGAILDFVHDRSFEPSKIRFDEKSKVLSIALTVISDEVKEARKFFVLKTWKHPVVEATLLIKNVISYSVKDDAKIDEGIVNTIALTKDEVVIECSVPVTVRATVSQSEIVLSLSDTVVSLKTQFALS
jgi:hypothetical protein